MVIGFINHNCLLFEASGNVYNVRFLSDLILNILVIITRLGVMYWFKSILYRYFVVVSYILFLLCVCRYSWPDIIYYSIHPSIRIQTNNWFYIRICFIYIFYNYLVFLFSYCKSVFKKNNVPTPIKELDQPEMSIINRYSRYVHSYKVVPNHELRRLYLYTWAYIFNRDLFWKVISKWSRSSCHPRCK